MGLMIESSTMPCCIIPMYCPDSDHKLGLSHLLSSPCHLKGTLNNFVIIEWEILSKHF